MYCYIKILLIFFHSSSATLLCMGHTFCLRIFFFFKFQSLFFFFFSFGGFHWDTGMLRGSFPSCVQFTNKPIKCILYFCYSVFGFWYFFLVFFFLRVFIALLTLLSLLFACWLLYSLLSLFKLSFLPFICLLAFCR